MKALEHVVEVEAPVAEVYAQWADFDAFPRFCRGVREVTRDDATHSSWTVTVGGTTRTFQAETVEQVPETQISWASTAGPKNSGTVLFHPLGEDRTRVTVSVRFEPTGALEKSADWLGLLEQRIKGDLRAFANFVAGPNTADPRPGRLLVPAHAPANAHAPVPPQPGMERRDPPERPVAE